MRVTPQSLRDMMIEEAEDLNLEGIAEKLFLIRRSDTQSRIHGLCDAHLGPHRV